MIGRWIRQIRQRIMRRSARLLRTFVAQRSFESNSDLEGQVFVQRAGGVVEPKSHSIESPRPKPHGAEMLLSLIAREWNRFYKAHPTATREQLLQKATDIDIMYGRWFTPPVGGGK
jgi:hypothetical protein